MITEPKVDKASLIAEQKLRGYYDLFERKYLDYRYEEVEDAETRTDQEPENTAQGNQTQTSNIAY